MQPATENQPEHQSKCEEFEQKKKKANVKKES